MAVTLAAVTAVVLIRTEVAETLSISSDSMLPTLHRGDSVLVDKLTLNIRPIRRGELVVFADPQDDSLVLKRVVGLAGNTVEIRDAVLFVDGDQVVEPSVELAAYDGAYFGPVSVPSGQLFVMGDNRANSIDSRSYGGVSLDRVVGRVRLISS